MTLTPALAAESHGESDRELVLLARGGDRSALSMLTVRHRRSAYLLALQLMGNPDDALDATQDALIKFCIHLERFDAERPLKPWLYSIVRNRCRDLLRRRRVRRAEPIDSDEDHWRPELVDESADPHADLERSRLRRRVWEALGELAPDHREILVLRDYQDLSYSEISDLLGVPQGTVMSRLHRARKYLANQLEPS
ncbi:MAG: RNA polymerase sigma factor [Thermoanaerobaculia bacterium]|nr:RNA polymerase sigma factor [Thermoanaerobaculia bacterium]